MISIHADLHTHSDHSDGVLTVAELASRARDTGLSALSLTDHDTVSGVTPLMEEAGSLEIVPGIELSTTYSGGEIHLLGYWVDVTHEPLLEKLGEMREGRRRRAEKIVDRLKEHSIILDFDEIRALTRDGLVGRPHIAAAMTKAGYVKHSQEAFDRYLGDGRPAAVGKDFHSPLDGIKLLREASALVSVAHPGGSDIVGLVPELKAHGLGALEVWHPKHTAAQGERLGELATSLGLVVTGGSDFHGFPGVYPTLGKYGLTGEAYETFTTHKSQT